MRPVKVIQDGNYDNGVKVWIMCPGFMDTDIGLCRPGVDPPASCRSRRWWTWSATYCNTGDSVTLGPEILLRTMRNPIGT